jgi:putative hydrolase of the HAD superfamily
MPGKPEAILFDLGGTLLEYENLTWQELSRQGFKLAFKVLQDSLEVLPDKDEFVRLFDDYFGSRYEDSLKTLVEVRVTELVQDCFTTLNLSGDGFLRREFLEAYYKPIADQVVMVKDAPAVLSDLKSSSFKLALVSNTIFPGDFHRRELKRFSLFNFFDDLLFSCEVGFKKPHPVIFKKALRALQVKPEKVVFIGDRLEEDIAGPQSLGMKAILKLTKGRVYSEDIKPDAIIEDLGEAPEAIEQLALEKQTLLP